MVLGGFTGSEVATKTVDVSYLYADMGFGFMPSKFLRTQGVSGDILRVYDDNSFRPGFGAGLRKYLFDTFDEFELYDFEINIRDQIERYEPRVTLESVDAELVNESRGGGTIQVTVKFRYTPINSSSPVSAEIRITTERVR